MYTIIYLRDYNNGQKERREITCDNIVDANRIRNMLRDDPNALEISVWQGMTQLFKT